MLYLLCEWIDLLLDLRIEVWVKFKSISDSEPMQCLIIFGPLDVFEQTALGCVDLRRPLGIAASVCMRVLHDCPEGLVDQLVRLDTAVDILLQ